MDINERVQVELFRDDSATLVTKFLFVNLVDRFGCPIVFEVTKQTLSNFAIQGVIHMIKHKRHIIK